MKLINLNDGVRKYMLQEIDMDISSNKLFISSRLNDLGIIYYPGLLKEAVEKFDITWFAEHIKGKNYLKEYEQKRKPKSTEYTMAKVPGNAHVMLSEGEFNRFYIRGLCLKAADDGIKELEIYRAKEVSNPRPESEIMIGKKIDVQSLLNDLRSNIGIDTALGVPPGPNSGLSVKLP